MVWDQFTLTRWSSSLDCNSEASVLECKSRIAASALLMFLARSSFLVVRTCSCCFAAFCMVPSRSAIFCLKFSKSDRHACSHEPTQPSGSYKCAQVLPSAESRGYMNNLAAWIKDNTNLISLKQSHCLLLCIGFCIRVSEIRHATLNTQNSAFGGEYAEYVKKNKCCFVASSAHSDGAWLHTLQSLLAVVMFQPLHRWGHPKNNLFIQYKSYRIKVSPKYVKF